MAEAPGHRLGQIVGNVLESALRPMLLQVAQEFGLYFDSQGTREARDGKKVTWKDNLGNQHDLDFVLERGGTEDRKGTPAAFIESAWRRYTKHSRNKAQEIQGALLPLQATYRNVRPFLGAVLAGDFTEGSIQQLRSSGFAVAHIPTTAIVQSFTTVGIDVGSAEETPDDYLAEQVAKFEHLPGPDRLGLEQRVRETGREALDSFFERLRQSLRRRVLRVTVLGLHGAPHDFVTISEAVAAVRSYRTAPAPLPFTRFEITVVYSNADRIQAEFGSPEAAVEFLATFDTVVTVPLH